MATFSVTEAFGAGFRLIARHPLAILAWAVAYLVIGLLPQLAVMGGMAPSMLHMFDLAAKAGRGPEIGDMIRLQSNMVVLQAVNYLCTIASQAVLTGAVLRAVLEPEHSRGFFLRIGRQELWIALVSLVFIVLLSMALFAVMVPIIVTTTVAGVAAERDGTVGIAGLLILAFPVVLLVLGWVCLRLSMTLPMTFKARAFRLFESWAVTRGQTLKLLALFLLLAISLVIIQIVVLGLAGAAVLALGIAVTPDAIEAFFTNPPSDWLHRLTPWIAAAAAGASLLSAAMFAIVLAPFAEVYRELTLPAAEPEPA